MKECGFMISSDKPYIGATPDRIITCDCCGQIPLEVKNPYTGRDLPICDYVLIKTGCLEKRQGLVQLKRNHAYFYQVQCQIYVTGEKFAYFCVCTKVGSCHVEKINFESEFVKIMLFKCSIFFKESIVKYLFAKSGCVESLEKIEVKDQISSPKSKLLHKNVTSNNLPSCSDQVQLVDFDTANVISVSESYICPACLKECLNNPSGYSELSIECSQCNLWFHLVCVGLKGTEACVKKKRAKWFCLRCVSEM